MSMKVKVKSLSRVRLFATLWTVAHQAPPSMEFSRQEYWSGLPFPSPGDLPNPGTKPGSPSLQADALPSEPPGNLMSIGSSNQCHNGSDQFQHCLDALSPANSILHHPSLLAGSEEQIKFTCLELIELVIRATQNSSLQIPLSSLKRKKKSELSHGFRECEFMSHHTISHHPLNFLS